jgi:hypothetical protein
MKDVNDFLLSETITVGKARKWMTSKDDSAKDNLISLIHQRFSERYLDHLKSVKSGFLKMAVCCLMIESMECFRQGKNDTRKRGAGMNMFECFFTAEPHLFPGFKDIYDEFYWCIRCGILHQAETTNGWRIIRRGPILDPTEKTINAAKFVAALRAAHLSYVQQLEGEDFNSPLWKNTLLKLGYICDNCSPQPVANGKPVSH